MKLGALTKVPRYKRLAGQTSVLEQDVTLQWKYYKMVTRF